MKRNNPFNYDVIALEKKAKVIRKLIVKTIAKANAGHPGGSLSSVEAATALFFNEMMYDPKNPELENRDRFVLSKGHCAPMLYSIFAETGQIEKELLWTFSEQGSPLQKHSERHRMNCVEVSTGSLGQGFSMAAGMALSAKSNKYPWRTYAIIGCGECNEGQIWETAMAASHFKLDNFCAILDYNKLQVDGTNDEVMTLKPVTDKFRSFGWEVIELDGHNMTEMLAALEKARETKGKPTMLVAHTIKGKGVSFMENRAEWHASGITKKQEIQALEDIENDY